MFRFGGFRAACPQAAFAQGVKSVFYMGQWQTRRHCSRMRSPFVFGHLDPKFFAASAVLAGGQSAGGLISAAAGEGGAITSATAATDLVSSLAMLEELMNAVSFCPNWTIRCSFPDWHQLSNTFYVISMVLKIQK